MLGGFKQLATSWLLIPHQTLSLFFSEDLEIPDTAFSIDKKLTAATLDVTVNVYNSELDAFVDLTVTIEWTATGPTSRYSDNWHFKSGEFIQNGHVSDAYVDAVADGSISTIDFNQAVSMFAGLDSIKESQLMRYR